MSSDLFESLGHLLYPRHIAIIGASATPGKSGHATLKNLIAGGYKGRISGINPRGGSAEGHSFLPFISDVEGTVDCAFISIPADLVPQAVRDCAKIGTRTLIIGANGFAELGSEAGRRRQSEIDSIARDNGIRIVGPNTNGIYNTHGRLSLGYNVSHADPMVLGPVSVVAHSGALFNSFYPRLCRFGGGLSKFIPVGNEADLTMLDFFEFFVSDPETFVICLILESITDAARFRHLAAAAFEAGKPVLVLKLGRSKAGAASALAHSSRLAGSGRAYDALFRDAGVVVLPSIEAMAGAAAVFSRHGAAPRPARPLIGVTTSGGGGALLADYAADRNLPLAGDAGHWTGAIADAAADIKSGGLIRNPVDLGNLPDHRLLEWLLEAQESEGENGPIAAFCHRLPTEAMDLVVADMLSSRQSRIAAPIVVIVPGGIGDAATDVYADAGILLSDDMATSFDILKAWHDNATIRSAPGLTAAALEDLALEFDAEQTVLPEIESAEILRLAGVPVIENRIIHPGDDVEALAAELGFPVVLKAIPADQTHKDKLGFVRIDIANAVDLDAEITLMRQRMTAQGYDQCEVPMLLQRMVRGRLELIVGASFEPGLGYFLMLGLGGVTTEILDEVVLFPFPADPTQMTEPLRKSKIGQLLDALAGPFDWAPNLIAIFSALQKVLRAKTNRAIQSIDLNPVILTATGFVAVDALIVLADQRNS